jgi:hypothetical protein
MDMSKPSKGGINVDVNESVPDWEPYTQPMNDWANVFGE